MEKLDIVREMLRQNSGVVVIGEQEKTNIGSHHWGHTVDIYVAPTDGLYTVEELQKFIASLVTELSVPPTMIDRFHDAGVKMNFGVLYYDEEITILRRVWVRPFPNTQIATKAMGDESASVGHCISKKELEQYRG